MTKADQYPHAPLAQAGQALESSRDSGFDLSAAVGELADNAFEGKAGWIRIATGKDASGSITDLAVADNGIGIPPAILASVLSLGYSTRYGSRAGLGRFGMGLKLASLSHALRTEIFSRPLGDQRIFGTYLDLEEVRSGAQKDLAVSADAEWPEEFVDLMADPTNNKPFETGTMVVWRKIDRLQQGGRFGSSVEERLQDLKKFLARAYRRFIDNGLRIEVDGRQLSLHDPLFLLENPRVTKKFKQDLRATKVDSGVFQVDGHEVKWVVTLLPQELRPRQGAGGRAGKGREEFAELYIPDNESRISILRNGREIYYDLVPRLYPGGRDKVDRYIGVEVEFPATLDEYFQVRNVKRGAEPVNKLREDLRWALKKPVEDARKSVRKFWHEVELRERIGTGDEHGPAHETVTSFDQTAPSGRAGLHATPDQVKKVLDEIVSDLGLDPKDPATEQKARWIRESFEARGITILDGQWPGKDLLDIRHLCGKAVVSVNGRHPFVESYVAPLRAMAKREPEDLDPAEASTLLRKLTTAIDLLLIAYAKAENMSPDPEEDYGELRTHWGLFAAGLLREHLKRLD